MIMQRLAARFINFHGAVEGEAVKGRLVGKAIVDCATNEVQVFRITVILHVAEADIFREDPFLVKGSLTN